MGQALTHQMIAREAAKMLIEENVVVKNINTARKVEFGEEVNGYKKGDTVKVAIPPVPVVFDGATFAGGGAAPAANESFVNLTLDTQKHVPLSFTAKEKLLDLTDFKKRFLRPAMESLSSAMNADLLTKMKNQTPNVVGSFGTIPSTRTPYRQAASMLDKYLAPGGDRSMHITSDSNDALAEANATLFHQGTEIGDEFDENLIGRFARFDFYAQQSAPLHTNGTGTGYLVGAAGQSGSTLGVITGTGILTQGTVFTIAGVFAVHPITGVSTGRLQQFLVATTYTPGGAGNVSIYPALTPTTASLIGNVNASPAANAPITVLGAVSTAALQNIGFHKDAFAAAFAPLPVIASCEGYTATVNGVSVRVMTFGDGKTDVENTRIDVLYGECAVRPYHSVRVTQ